MPRKCNRGITFHNLQCFPLGESALVVRLGDAIDAQLNANILALEEALQSDVLRGVLATVPAYASLTVHFDPLQINSHQLTVHLQNLAARIQTHDENDEKIIEVPVRYGGEYGPDLEFVAAHTKLTVDRVIELHSQANYRVHFIGFLPGFPYLGGMDERLKTPRLQTPRTLVKAGSIGIAGSQTGIYPFDSPGGWRIIGWTPLKLFDPNRTPPALFAPGTVLRFVPMQKEELSHAAGD